MINHNPLAGLPVDQGSVISAPPRAVSADTVLEYCTELEAALPTLESRLAGTPWYGTLGSLKRLLKRMQDDAAKEPALVTVCGKEMTAHDAHQLATFAKALRDNACPYCAQPIHVSRPPAQESAASGEAHDH